MSLRFGTAGLRAPVGPGRDQMNVAQVTRTSAAVAAWLSAKQAATHIGEEPTDPVMDHFSSLSAIEASHIRHNGTMRVVIGFDARYGSHVFATCASEVFAGAGFEVTLLPYPTPTPIVPWLVRKDEYDAGIQITASHNPAGDNGYKIYLDNGLQIDTQSANEIETMMALVDDIQAVPRVHVRPSTETERRYVDDIIALIEPGQDDRLRVNNERAALKIVYTAMHGVGSRVLSNALQNSGFALSWAVASQEHPDPTFPTIPFPNPEEPGATDEVLALAREKDADIIIALDPDADRCAIGIRTGNRQHRMLRGDELGPLLATRLVTESGSDVATTFVSSRLLREIAEDRGWNYFESVTGFKNLMRTSPNLKFAYEEAIGTAPAPWIVGDKDGIATALVACAWAAELKAKGLTLEDELRALYRRYGVHLARQVSKRTTDPRQLVETLGLRPEIVAGGVNLTRCDPLAGEISPEFDGVMFNGTSDAELKIRVVARASGTENKTKIYVEVSAPAATDLKTAPSRATVAALLDAVCRDVEDLVTSI
ncbi:MAG: phospho-sugar mutase [Corynebacterium sp.]|nr:phospho-sugar mutase [Corynebacterium sp.]